MSGMDKYYQMFNIPFNDEKKEDSKSKEISSENHGFSKITPDGEISEKTKPKLSGILANSEDTAPKKYMNGKDIGGRKYRVEYPQSHGPSIHGLEKYGFGYFPTPSPEVRLNEKCYLLASKTILKSCFAEENEGRVFIDRRYTHFGYVRKLLNVVLTGNIRFVDIKRGKFIGKTELEGYSAQDVVMGLGHAHKEWALDFLNAEKIASYSGGSSSDKEVAVMFFLIGLMRDDWFVDEMVKFGMVVD